jgi:hypothetical protein
MTQRQLPRRKYPARVVKVAKGTVLSKPKLRRRKRGKTV